MLEFGFGNIFALPVVHEAKTKFTYACTNVKKMTSHRPSFGLGGVSI